MPDSASAQVKVTMTSALFQPFAFAGGACVWPIVGGVLSIEMSRVFGSSLLPALSRLHQRSVWFPSVLMDTLVPVSGAPPSRM
jgi:hypothetical protein